MYEHKSALIEGWAGDDKISRCFPYNRGVALSPTEQRPPPTPPPIPITEYYSGNFQYARFNTNTEWGEFNVLISILDELKVFKYNALDGTFSTFYTISGDFFGIG